MCVLDRPYDEGLCGYLAVGVCSQNVVIGFSGGVLGALESVARITLEELSWKVYDQHDRSVRSTFEL